MAIGGQMRDDCCLITCKEINSATEGAAADLEQLFISGMTDFYQRSKQEKKFSEKNSGKILEPDTFSTNECPSDKEIQEEAKTLEITFMANTFVKMSELLETFTKIVDAKLILGEANQPITSIVWNTIKRYDKQKILFWYCAFFVNPLSRLSIGESSTESPSSQGTTTGKKTQ